MESIKDRVTLNNGIAMPKLGFGVFGLKEEELMAETIQAALDAGYESFDTAWRYANEDLLGKAFKHAGVKRDQLFISTKIWNANHAYETALWQIDDSLKNLQMDYLDLILIHWPVPLADRYLEAYRAMETALKQGKVRAIGVSNFTIPQLERVLKECDVVPAVNQVEWHPACQQEALFAFCKEKGIQLEAHSTFGKGRVFKYAAIAKLAEKYHKTPTQITLRWDLQRGIVVIPKSQKKERIYENADIFDFSLTEEEVQSINECNEMMRTAPHPEEYFGGIYEKKD